MVFILLTLFAILFILLSKHLFEKWFNHLSAYTFIWYSMLVLYELKLIKYYNLTFETWFVILAAFAAYILGIFTFFTSRKALGHSTSIKKNTLPFDSSLFLNNSKILKYTIIITGLIGLYGAITNWLVLLNKFGSISNVMIYANVVYKARVSGSLDFLPYFTSFSYVSIFFCGLYVAKRNRFSFFLLIPFVAVVLTGLSNMGRAGMLFALFEFSCVVIFVKYTFKKNELRIRKDRKKLVITFISLLLLLVVGATLVKSLRNPGGEKFRGSTNTLNNLEVAGVITPSIYLYLSANVVVLNEYLKLQEETASWGQNTFLPVYNLLSKFKVVQRPETYMRFYFTPVYTNTATFLRDLLVDFGVSGILMIPYFLGLLLTFLWFKFFSNSSVLLLVILVYLYVIMLFSFLMMYTRSGDWTFSLLILLLIAPILEKSSKIFFGNNEIISIEQ
jgi:oligosaccharide repeat unit polymerase